MIITDTDDDNYRPSKRSRADFRPPAAPRSYDDTDGMQSSPGMSQQGHSRDDVPMTDRTDDYPYEVQTFPQLQSFWHFKLHLTFLIMFRMKMMIKASLRCIASKEH